MCEYVFVSVCVMGERVLTVCVSVCELGVTLGAHARGFLCVCLSVCYRSSCFSVPLDMEPTILTS